MNQLQPTIDEERLVGYKHMIEISNWYCPKCERAIASEDVSSGKHRECKTKVEWRTYKKPSVKEYRTMRDDSRYVET